MRMEELRTLRMSRFVESDTGHRETVKKVTYNPEIYHSKLTHAFFMVIDPTVQNEQDLKCGTVSDGVYCEDDRFMTR